MFALRGFLYALNGYLRTEPTFVAFPHEPASITEWETPMKTDNQSPNPMVFTVIYDPDEQAFQLAFADSAKRTEFKRKPGCDAARPSRAIRIEMH